MKTTLSLNYANNLIYELEKAFWDERGKGARFRMTTVGREFFSQYCRPLLQSDEVVNILDTVAAVLKEKGIAANVSYNLEDRLLKVAVKGCLHRQVEERMLAQGIEPFTCVPANLIVLAIEEKLDRPVEIAEIKCESGNCHVLMILFEKRPTLD